MSKINWEFEGTVNFIREAEYSMELHTFFQDFEDNFQNAKSVDVILEELPPTVVGRYDQPKSIVISKDKSYVKIHYTTWRYFDKNFKETGKPTPNDFYKSLSGLMNKAVEQFSQELDQN